MVTKYCLSEYKKNARKIESNHGKLTHNACILIALTQLKKKQWKAISRAIRIQSHENRITSMMNTLWPSDCKILKCNISNYLVNFRFSLLVESFELSHFPFNAFIEPLTDVIDDAIDDRCDDENAFDNCPFRFGISSVLGLKCFRHSLSECTFDVKSSLRFT